MLSGKFIIIPLIVGYLKKAFVIYNELFFRII